MLARVPVRIVKPLDDLDVTGPGMLGMRTDPVFRRHVHVAPGVQGLARDGIAHAGEAVGAVRLIRQEGGRVRVADAGGAECEEFRPPGEVVVVLAQLGRSEGGKGTAEGVASHDEAVGRMVLDGVEDLALDAVAHLSPGVPEALVHMAVAAEVRLDSEDLDVDLPVRERLGTSEGEHDEAVGVVDREEPRVVGPEGVFELQGAVRPGSFDQRAVPCLAGDGVPGAIVVARTIGGRRVLSHQLELVQQVRGNADSL